MDWTTLADLILLVSVGGFILNRVFGIQFSYPKKRSRFVAPSDDRTRDLRPEDLPHYQEWIVDYQLHTFKVTHWYTLNWWKYKKFAAARLFINDQLVDENTRALPDPQAPILANDNYSAELTSVRVFYCPHQWMGGTWTPLIVVNGDIIHQPDKWTSAMKWFWKTSEKELGRFKSRS